MIYNNIKLYLGYSEDDLRKKLRRLMGRNLPSYRVVKRSVDARDKSRIRFVLSVGTGPELQEYKPPEPRRAYKCRPIIAGSGPAGLFCALTLARAGLPPIILERGKDIGQRKADMRKFWQSGSFLPDSNALFGEGGAGTFSDGKLTTGINDPRIPYILRVFVECGAPPEILYDAKPHIGTDRLAGAIQRLRGLITGLGAEYRFEHRLADLEIDNERLKTVQVDAGGDQYSLRTDALCLATGHSARDTYAMLRDRGVGMAQKAFSVGLRIEHPQELVDIAQYGSFAGHPKLGHADYKLSAHLPNGRNAYTFCMCPGGVVIGAISEESHLSINGMSHYARGSVNANSALLVSITPKDYHSADPLAGIEFQRGLESRAFIMGGGGYRAPAQLSADFIIGSAGTQLGIVSPSYKPGVKLVDLNGLFPPELASSLKEAIVLFGKKMNCFSMPGAVLTAVESRSSSPVRVLRGEDFQGAIKGIFPCGEGAGYAGGIMSAAVDGIKCAEAMLTY